MNGEQQQERGESCQGPSKNGVRRAFFYASVVLFVLVVFVCNRNHRSQQGGFRGWYCVLASNLVRGLGYSAEREDLPDSVLYASEVKNPKPVFFPIWGYPFLIVPGILLGSPSLFLLVVQFFLCIAGLLFFYRVFRAKESFWHIPLFLPFVAEMSVKWPQAITSFLLIAYVYSFYHCLRSPRRILLVLPGMLLGVAANFRSDYFYLAPFQICMVVLPQFKGRRKLYLVLTAVTVLTTMVCLMPWALRSYVHASEIRFTAANVLCFS
jgi:hypothetical protein